MIYIHSFFAMPSQYNCFLFITVRCKHTIIWELKSLPDLEFILRHLQFPSFQNQIIYSKICNVDQYCATIEEKRLVLFMVLFVPWFYCSLIS